MPKEEECENLEAFGQTFSVKNTQNHEREATREEEERRRMFPNVFSSCMVGTHYLSFIINYKKFLKK